MQNDTIFYGFTEAQLQEAFDKVKDRRDWKAPIMALVYADDVEVTYRSIEFFTATQAIFIPRPNNMYCVEAAGYRAGPTA